MRRAGPRVASRSLRLRSQRSRSVEYSVEHQCHARSRVFAMAADAGGDPKQLSRQQWRPLCGLGRRRRNRPGHREYPADAATVRPARVHGGRSARGEILHPPHQWRDRRGPERDAGRSGTRRRDEKRQCSSNSDHKLKRNGKSKPAQNAPADPAARPHRPIPRAARHSTLSPGQRRLSSMTQRPMPLHRMRRQKPHRTMAIMTRAAVRPTPALPPPPRRPTSRRSPLPPPLSPMPSSTRRRQQLLGPRRTR